MNLFAPPKLIIPEVYAELPKKFRRSKVSAERIAAGRPAPAGGCFLEGPSFDRKGNLYFTDQGQSGLQDPVGRVYRLSAAGKLTVLADNIPSPNGLVLNNKENTLFVGVTRANAVWRLPLLPDGTVSRMGVYIQLSGGRGPDGMAIDEDDGLAVAHPDMGAVWVFNHRGEPLYRIQSPKSDIVTNCAYGGADRKTLFIVDSDAGCILSARLPTAGRKMYSHCRVGGGALARWPPSAAQTARAVFPHAAFTKVHGCESQSKESIPQDLPAPTRHRA